MAKGLGKGLDALFGQGTGVVGVRIADIEPNPAQPRRVFDQDSLEELAESIRENGVISPITVRRNGDRYAIIAGERRWRAARMAGLTEIPAMILDVEDTEVYPLALIENLQRQDLNPMEEAEGYRRLMDEYGMTQEQAAARVGRSRPAVANAVRLLELPAEVRSMVESGAISPGHARAVLAMEDEGRMIEAAKIIEERGLSVRDAEKLAKRGARPPSRRPKKADIYAEALGERLSSSMGRKVTVRPGRKKGTVTIEYYGNADLDELCRILERK